MTASRAVALVALDRIEDGAFANIVTPRLLDRSDLSPRDRAFVTDLVYGTTRMRRALDWWIAPHVRAPGLDRLDPSVRSALRLPTLPPPLLKPPPPAAVSATVDIAPRRAAGLVNAVLRKLAANGPPLAYPDDATRLSYPDWIVAALINDVGRTDAIAALEQMNEPAEMTVR